MKLTPAQQREIILGYFYRWHTRPVLIGQIATELRCSLNEAESYLHGLATEGVIRLATKEECRRNGVTHGYVKI